MYLDKMDWIVLDRLEYDSQEQAARYDNYLQSGRRGRSQNDGGKER